MTFDAETFSFHGMADKYWVPYDAIQRNYYKEEKICLFAYDPGDANSSTCFTLVIKSNLPYENELKSLVSQFKFFKPTVSVDLEIVLESDTFLDQNNDTISYNIRLVDEYNPWPEMPEYRERRLLESDSDSNGITSAAEDTEPLPAIMTYDAEIRKLSISPTLMQCLVRDCILQLNSRLQKLMSIIKKTST